MPADKLSAKNNRRRLLHNCPTIVLTLYFTVVFSFSNLFSPSNKSPVKQQNALDVRYSTLQSADNGTGDQASQNDSAGARSPRIVRFRDEDMYVFTFSILHRKLSCLVSLSIISKIIFVECRNRFCYLFITIFVYKKDKYSVE